MTEYHDIQGLFVRESWLHKGDSEEVEKFLTFIGEVQVDEQEWNFHLVAFWIRKSDGQVLWAEDSGCSCPSPFEDTLVSDLRETSLLGVTDIILGAAGEYSYARPRAELVRDARQVIEALRENGARA